MSILTFLSRIQDHKANPAIVFNDETYDYNWLIKQEKFHFNRLKVEGIEPGSKILLIADYSPTTLSILMALMRLRTIIAPITNKHQERQNEYNEIIKPDFILEITNDEEVRLTKCIVAVETNALICELKEQNTAGLIILSSGSTGKPKAIVHDLALLIKGHHPSRTKLNVLSFLLFDHIGGINSLLNALISGNCVVVPKSRTPIDVVDAISQHKVDVLITSPSFLNLMLISNVFQPSTLNSLKQINYGSEVMPAALLERLIQNLPNTKFIQAYGLSELGVIRTKTNNHHSNLITIDDNNIVFRIKNNKLEIKSSTSMLGYLNAPSPFTEDGWFITGDIVEVVGDSFRILGRDSEVINIGGEKVFPTEIENILLQIPGVEDATVFGEKNMILGNIVVAKIKTKPDVNPVLFKETARQFCLNKMPAFKVPQKFQIVSQMSYGERYKKIRKEITN